MAHLLQSVHDVVVALDIDFNIHQHNEAIVSISNIPHRHLKPAIRHIATRARTKASCNQRQEIPNFTEIDSKASNSIFKDLSKQDANVLRILMAGSAWANEALYHCGQTSERECDLCGKNVRHTPGHLILHCPFLL